MAKTNRTLVLADWLFATPTIIIQPATGLSLLALMGIWDSWIVGARLGTGTRC